MKNLDETSASPLATSYGPGTVVITTVNGTVNYLCVVF